MPLPGSNYVVTASNRTGADTLQVGWPWSINKQLVGLAADAARSQTWVVQLHAGTHPSHPHAHTHAHTNARTAATHTWLTYGHTYIHILQASAHMSLCACCKHTCTPTQASCPISKKPTLQCPNTPIAPQVDKELAALKESLKEAEEALIPPRITRLVRSASGHLNDKWGELQASPVWGEYATRANQIIAQISAQIREILSMVVERAGPYASEGASKASEVVKTAGVKVRQVQEELTALVDHQLRAVPALAQYADPVVVQALVYAIMGLPVLLLLPVLSALLGGRRRGGSGSEGKAAGGKRAAANGKKAAAAKPVGKQGGKKVVRDGKDGECAACG